MVTTTSADVDSHTRSITIFGSYFALCIALLSLVLSTVRFRNYSRAPRAWVFTLLTLASLGTTWFYMVLFFMKSYRDWELLQTPSLDGAVRLGPWLKDVKLFEEAWGTVVEEPARWLWSQQIFLATCGWTVFLAAEGSRRGIRHLWAFMLLGQVVAISFVVNLFFLTLILHDASPAPPKPAPKLDAATRKSKGLPSWAYFAVTLPLAVSFLFSFMTPSMINTRAFLPFLLIPHVLLLFVPSLFEYLASCGMLRVYIPANEWQGFWKQQYRFCAFVSAVCHATALSAVAVSGMTVKVVFARIAEALYDHPAVSSVGWDVIMVGVSIGMWVGVSGLDFGLEPEKRRRGGDWASAVVGWLLMAMGSVGLDALVFSGEL